MDDHPFSGAHPDAEDRMSEASGPRGPRRTINLALARFPVLIRLATREEKEEKPVNLPVSSADPPADLGNPEVAGADPPSDEVVGQVGLRPQTVWERCHYLRPYVNYRPLYLLKLTRTRRMVA